MKTTASSNTRKKSSVDVEIDSVTVNLFFDGTKNNMHHTDLYDEKIHSAKSSYANAYSNIAWMFRRGFTNNDQLWLYIEGIGTRLGDTDDEIDGYAVGRGVTGIDQRALQAFDQIEDLVGETPPTLLYINVFGFSRGAATARHFVHLAKSRNQDFVGGN